MNTHDGYKKLTLDNTLVLLAGGGHKALSDFAMSNSYVKISGDTMTGILHMKALQYADTANTGALDLANSDIYGVNSIKFADLCDAAAEGLQWYRDATHIDTMWVKNGVMYFTPNREWNKTATNYVILHHGNVGLYTGGSGNLTANAALGTNGNVYLTLKAADTYFKHNIVGEGSVGVTSDANGKIIITGDTFPYHFNIGNSSTKNTWIQFATITTTAGNSTLRTVFFTLLFSNNECLEHSSFILTCAIRRTSTSQCSSDFIYTPLGTSLPKTIRLVSDDNKTFKCYIQCNANTYNGYYQVTKLGERMTDSSDTTITYSNTLTNTEPTGSVLQKNAVRSYDSDTYATTIAVTDKSTHSSSAQSYWIPMVSTYNGNASVYGSTDFFMYRNSTGNYLNIGKAGITSGITFHHVNESSGAYGDLVSSACTALRLWILPNASGTIALTSDIYNKTDSDARYVLKSGDTMTGGLSLKVTDIDASKANNNISSTLWPSTMNVIDNANRIITRVESIVESSGNIALYMYVRQYDTSGNQIAQKGLRYTMAKDGTGTWTVNDAPSFRTALGLGSIATYASSDFVKKIGDTMTGSLTISNNAECYLKFGTDTSRMTGYNWLNTSGTTIAGVWYHNTGQNVIINPTYNTVSSIWDDAVGKYSLFVGINKFTYNACPVVLHKNMSNSDITGESGTFFFSGAGTLKSEEDYVGYQVGDAKDKWQMVSYAGNLRWRQNDTGGTNSANWNAFKTILDSDNSSVSGGGSTWGSSITVKINGTSKTLTVPSDPSGNFVKKTGDTMSGSLTIAANAGLTIVDPSGVHDAWLGWTTHNSVDYFFNYAYETKYWAMTFGTHPNAVTNGGLCFAGTDGNYNWGIGTLSPAYKFDVQGTGRYTGQLTLSVAQGTAPLAITSTTLCTNLNADLLDGLHSSNFMQNYNWGSQTINANSLTGSGAHRLSGSGSNFPVTNPNYGQMLTVFGGGDTVTQLYFPYDSSTAWLRSGNPLHSSGNGTWRAWRQIAFKDEIVSFSGTVNRFAYYNTASSISSTTNVSLLNGISNNKSIQLGIRIGGQCYGNTASTLVSGVAGNISYGDGGPLIIFSSGMADDTDDMQSGAIIFTTHNSASYGGGYGFHFVGRGEVVTRNGSQVTLGDTAGVAVISDIFGVKDRMYFYKPNTGNNTGAIYLKYANSALSVTGPFMVSTGQYNGLRFINGSGLTVNTSNDKGITLINGYFRFTNADEWDYSKWAGLGYDSTNKVINLGIPGDGTVFQKNSAVNKDGTLKLVNIKYIKLDGASGDTYTVYHTGNLSLSNYASSGHNHDDRYVKKVGDTMTGNLSIKLNSADLTQTNNGLSSGTVLYPGFRTADKNNKINAQFIGVINYTSGRSAFRASAMLYDSSGNKIKDVGLGYTINKDGTGYWEVNDAPAFRTAIGLGSITTYSSDDFVKKIGDTMTGALQVKHLFEVYNGTSSTKQSAYMRFTRNGVGGDDYTALGWNGSNIRFCILGGNGNYTSEKEALLIGYNGQLKLQASNGTAPITTSSTTLVTNLNADLLDGRNGAEYAMIGSLATDIANNTDLNNIVSAGTYTCQAGSVAATLGNTPYKGGNFRLWHIINTGTNGSADSQWSSQMLLAPNDARLFLRSHNQNAFGGWREFAFTDGTIANARNADLLDGYHASSFILANTAGGIATVSGGGNNWYFRIATINITSSYINRPVAFEISQRGYEFSVILVIFTSANNSDPTLTSFTTDNVNVYYIKKVATSKWEIYGKYYEVWGSATLHRITGCGANIGVTVDMVNIGTDDPTGTTRCLKLHLGRLETANWAYGADEAYELTTPRLIWGLSFDGTDNISGNMTGVTNIDSLLYFDTTNSRVGIGTSSPGTKFEINGGSNGTALKLTTTTTYSCINYKQSSGANWSAGSNSTSLFYFWNSTKNATVAYFDVNGALTCSGVVYKGLTNPGNYVFTCDGSYIAKSSLGGGSSGITISSVTLASTSYYPIMVTGTGSKTTAYIANPSSGAKFYATSSGVFFTSDAQLKTNISRYFVNREISENPVRKFDWKNGEGRNVVGFIAQEVEQWCPEAVNIDEFGYKSLNYNATLSALCGYLFDKVKELESTIKELRSLLNANKC